MEPVFNQALQAGHVGFVTDTYIQCISSGLESLTSILTFSWCFFQHWCMQQKVLLLNINNIGQSKGDRSTVIHCLTDCDTTNVSIG